MRGEWAYYKSRFSPARCQDIINIANSRPAQTASMGVNGETKDNNYRRSRIRFIHPGDHQLDWLFTDIWKMVLQANDEWFGFHLSKLDYLQIAEYNGTDKGEYKRHQDVFWMNGDPKYHRKLSVIIQLSDPVTYQGGDFEMYDIASQPNPADIKAQGTVILFPSFVSHAALPVTAGNRWSIAAWVDGKKWT
jgi:PKHD-type hydroxylase